MSALGARRSSLVRSALIESLLLGLLGGLLGAAFAFGGLRVILALIPITMPFWLKVEIDSTVLLFSLAVSVGTGMVFGLALALRTSRVDLTRVLSQGGRGQSRRGQLRSVLVVAEVDLRGLKASSTMELKSA
jgi:putative ABC transport system permease protein